MKRPYGIYAVIIWFWVGIYSQNISPIIRFVLPNYVDNQTILQSSQLLGAIFLIVIAVGLFQLKFVSRVLASICFSLVAVYQIFAITMFLIYGPLDTKIIGYKMFLAAPSILCLIYLWNKKFLNLSKNFLEFKEKVAAEKAIKKRLKA